MKLKHLVEYRGRFVSMDDDDDDAREVSAPGEGQPYPILAGGWPNEHAHALRRMCSCCKGAVGISPTGYALHQADPVRRPILCAGCMLLLTETIKGGGVTQ